MQSKKALTILCCTVAACALLCAVGLVILFVRGDRDKKEYEDLRNNTILIVQASESPAITTPEPVDEQETPAPTQEAPAATNYAPVFKDDTLTVDFSALKCNNADVAAWLYLPNTVINYPIAAADKERNEEFYLTHSFNGRSSGSGSIFIEQKADKNFNDKNTLIHGHRRNDGTMFGSLYKYADQSYYQDHPILQLYTPSDRRLLYVLASFEEENDGFFTKTSFKDNDAFLAFVRSCKEKSDIKTTVEVDENDRLVTLITCVVGRDTLRQVVVCVQRTMP